MKEQISDIIFLVDTSADMKVFQTDIYNHIKTFCTKLYNDPINDLRVQIKGYRDRDNYLGIEMSPNNDFSLTLKEVIDELDKIEYRGGEDEREPTVDAILTLLNSDWRINSKRLIIVFTNTRSRQIINSSYHSNEELMVKLESELLKYNIHLFLYAVKSSIYQGIIDILDRTEGILEEYFSETLEKAIWFEKEIDFIYR